MGLILISIIFLLINLMIMILHYMIIRERKTRRKEVTRLERMFYKGMKEHEK